MRTESNEGRFEYERQLLLMRGMVRQATDSLDRGEGAPLDVSAIVDRVRTRLAEQGILDRQVTGTS